MIVPAIAAPGHAQVGGEAGSGGVSIGLAEAPSDRADDPRARTYVIDHLAPGATIERSIRVANTTERPQQIDLYAAAAAIAGASMHFAEGRSTNELSSWTSVSPARVDIAAGGEVSATVAIAVPEDASEGERYAVVWAELAPNHSSPIMVVNRVGIRMYLSVGEGAEPASDFAIESLTAARADDGAPVVRALVRNTGGRALDMSGELSLTDGPGGLSAGPFPARLGSTLGIGAANPVEVPLSPELPAGPWNATITVRSGTLERTAEAVITFPDEAGTSGEAVMATSITDSTGGRLALTLAVALALAVLVAALWFVRANRGRRRMKADDGDAVTPVITA